MEDGEDGKRERWVGTWDRQSWEFIAACLPFAVQPQADPWLLWASVISSVHHGVPWWPKSQGSSIVTAVVWFNTGFRKFCMPKVWPKKKKSVHLVLSCRTQVPSLPACDLSILPTRCPTPGQAIDFRLVVMATPSLSGTHSCIN